MSTLEWGPESPSPMPWDKSNAWVASLGDGWRLPTLGELRCAWEDNATLQTFCHKWGVYWSSSACQVNPTHAWFVGFSGGFVFAENKSSRRFVRAVRGGSETLQAKNARLRADIERLTRERDEARALNAINVCAYCRTQFERTEAGLDALTAHIVACNDNPLVQMVRQLRSEAKAVAEDCARAERERDELIAIKEGR